MQQVLVSGSMAYDRIMDFPGFFKDHFLPEKLHAISVSFGVETVAENFGGTAGNIAYDLSLLGISPRILSTAGRDFDRYKTYLNSLGIDPTSVQIDLQKLTAAAFMMTDKSNNQITAFSMGAGATPYVPLPRTDEARCAIIGAGCVQDMHMLPAHFRTAGIQYMYDPGQALPGLSEDDVKDGITGAAAVFANDYELGLITQKTGLDERTIPEKAVMLIVTYGEKGSRITTKNAVYEVPAITGLTVVDPTGAGDAYRAGFIAGYLRELSPEVCGRLGSTLASFAVEKYGTQNHKPSREEMSTRFTAAYGGEYPL